MKENMVGKNSNGFDFIKVIGEGAWAVVYLASDAKGNQVAIKSVPKAKIKEVPKLEELVKTQIKVLRSCKNQNVIHFIDTFTSDKSIFIATQFCNGGDLQQYLIKKKTLTEAEATIFLKHILNGFKGLHEVKAMHRDFKLANVLLHNGVCKIADLGFAKQMVSNITKTVLGTSLTMAPQVLDEKPYGLQADIWSIGVVYFQMIYGKYPYEGRSDNDILKKIKQYRPDFSKMRISDNCRDFIDKCLTPDPKKRITWKQIYEHPLIKGNEKQSKFLPKDQQKFNNNKNFYNNVEDKNFLKYPQLGQIFDVGDVQFKQADIRQTLNYHAKLQLAQKKKQMEQLFGKYSKQYFDMRDNIMFVFKYIAPHVYKLFNLKANHEINMFILSKHSYLRMKKFYNSIKFKDNIMKIYKYWEQFTCSPQYSTIEEKIRDDYEFVRLLCMNYQMEIQSSNQRIQQQFDIENVGSSNFDKLVFEIGEEYWFLLAENLSTMKNKERQSLIKMLQALEYFNNKKAQTNVEQFDRTTLVINLNEAEKNIQTKVNSIFEG